MYHGVNSHSCSARKQTAAPQTAESTQIIARKRPSRASRTRGINQHIRASIVNLMLRWPNELPRLRNVAYLAGTSEALVVEVIREWMKQADTELKARRP